MDKILRIDMTNLKVTDEPYPEEWQLLGGRALSAKIMLKEVDPTCDPLGPDNKVVIAPGVLSGSVAPTSGRMSVGGKSPLTGGIKEANSGGQPGQKLMRLGYRCVIVEGKAKDPDKRYLVVVNQDGYEMKEAPELKMLRTYSAVEKMNETYSERASYVLVGPAGELGLSGASVAFSDEGARRPTRHAARGGLGASLGVKGLKAIVVDDTGHLIASYMRHRRDGCTAEAAARSMLTELWRPVVTRKTCSRFFHARAVNSPPLACLGGL